jgi:hypothetical protein
MSGEYPKVDVCARARQPLLRYPSIDAPLCDPGLEYKGFFFRSVHMAYQAAKYMHLQGDAATRPDLVAQCAINGEWERCAGTVARRIGSKHHMRTLNVKLNAQAWEDTTKDGLLEQLIKQRCREDKYFRAAVARVVVQQQIPVERLKEKPFTMVNLRKICV